MRVLALVPEGYGGFGGIAVYNEDLLNALCELPYVTSVEVLPRLIRSDPKILPEKVSLNVDAAKGKFSYVKNVFFKAIEGDYDLIVCSHMHLLPFAYLCKFRGKTRPIIGVIYGTEAWKPTGRIVSDFLIKRCDNIVCISDFTEKKFREWSGVCEKNISIIPNAIHVEKFGVGEKPEYLVKKYEVGSRKVILTLGRLDARQQQKGFDELITVLPAILEKDPNIVCLIAGGGSDLERLKHIVKDKCLENNVIFTGFITENEKADHYRLADVFSLAGRQEGFGFVLLEALACGIPVVGSVLDGSSFALQNGQLGELANPDELQSLQEAIFRAIGKKKNIPTKLQYFSYENFVSRLDILIGSYSNFENQDNRKA